MLEWEKRWDQHAAEQTKRHAAVGIRYPITERPSEIVACAIMSKKASPLEYVADE